MLYSEHIYHPKLSSMIQLFIGNMIKTIGEILIVNRPYSADYFGPRSLQILSKSET